MEQKKYESSQHSKVRLLSIICCLLFIISVLPASAQRRKTPAIPLTEQVEQALEAYDFETADELLDKEIATLKKKRKPTDHLDEYVRRARQGLSKLHATERITVIDSIVCPKEEALKTIRLSRESGRIDTYASSFHTRDNSDATIYENELGNKRYVSIPSSLRLAVTDKIGDQWSEAVPLTGLNDNDLAQNYPFLLSDGITLYYAATGPESLGGYDIFVSRADGEDGTFLSPENVGFPFNSTANDYLLAIDELNQLGWFVSDRYQPEGKVCVYVFIPNETREVYGDDVDDDELRDLARLTSLRDTWVNAATDDDAIGAVPAAVVQAQQRFADIRMGKSQKTEVVEHEFDFVIDNQRTYTSLADFRSPVARDKMQQWIALSKTERTDATMLQRLRDNYATANAAQRQQLAPTIQRLEQTYYPLLEQLKTLAKEIRNAEIAP